MDLDPGYSRFLLEYDQLCSKAGVSNEDRLDLLEERVELAEDRDALYVEYITLLNNTCQYDKALSCLGSHRFHPWEGGEGKVSTQYRYALTQKAIQLLDEKKYDEAIQLLEQTKVYPENLAKESFQTCRIILPTIIWDSSMRPRAKAIPQESVSSVPPSDWMSLEAYYITTISLPTPSFTRDWQTRSLAIRCGTQMLPSADLLWRETCIRQVGYDYFAVSLPEIEVFPSNIKDRNDTYCHYLIALGNLGLGNLDKQQSS